MRDAAGELADRVHLLGLCELLLQFALLGRVERIDHRAFLAGVFGRRNEETRRARTAAGLVFEHDINRAHFALAFNGVLDRRAQRRAVAFAESRKHRPGRRGPALPRLHGLRQQIHESGVRRQHAALSVERRHRHRGRIEKAREPNFGGAQILFRLFAGRAVERQGARGARLPVLAESHLMQQPDGERLTVTAPQVEVDLLGAHVPRGAGYRREKRRAIVGDN